MELKLVRLSESDDATLGILFDGMTFVCYTLEDEYRKDKIRGETRIPEGNYKVKFRKVESPKTLSYREKYPWFEYHLELQDVPGFQYVYIHIGNDDDDSDGCILVGSSADSKNFKIWESTKAFEYVYKKVSKELEQGKDVELKIFDRI